MLLNRDIHLTCDVHGLRSNFSSLFTDEKGSQQLAYN